MEGSRTHWRLKQRCGNPTDILEPYYDVVDDQETVHNVHIQPARPIHDEREYADRDLPRSSSAQSLSSDMATGHSKPHPTYPPRKIKPAPAINRDIKPGKRKKPAANLQSMQHTSPPSRRCPPSPHFPAELLEQLNGMALQESTGRLQQRPAKNVSELRSQSKGSQIERARFSVDMEAQHIAERWSNEELDLGENDETKLQQYSHEWPQMENVFDQHTFFPLNKSQIHSEDDWYIGQYGRTDAEHALHLVNKDGAFLVRDCSLNSSSEPFVLSVYYQKKVYNVKIRFIESHRKYALGTGQRSNEMFDAVSDIIKFHSIFPIVLISAKNFPGGKGPENCVLTFPVTKEDVDRLLQ